MKQVFSKQVRQLLEHSHKLVDLQAVSELLGWDQETYLPDKGAPARASQLATMAAIHHEALTQMPLEVFGTASKNKYDLALGRELKREYDRAVKLPQKLVAQISHAKSTAVHNWKKAKHSSNFTLFAPFLSNLLKLKILEAQKLSRKGQDLYDVMLDEFEPDLTAKEVERIFGRLKSQLTALAAKLTPITKGADTCLLKKNYDQQAQWDLGLKIAQDMGYDLQAGRQDKTAHPFTTQLGSSGDVRITNRIDPTDFRPNLFAAIHEAGHALYEQGSDPRLDRTHLAGGVSLVMHESQSRLWENMVGRSSWFWQKYYPLVQRTFPHQLKSVSLGQFVKAVNMVQSSLIRVEADEVTYGLHIIARFEIEKDLIAGKIQVKDLPRIWNQKYHSLLGITPPNDQVGVLQDIHWAMGIFGYFPTYLLGTLASAQIWHILQTKYPKLVTKIKRGELLVLRQWLKERIHRHGKVYRTQELLIAITGEPLNPDYFIKYLENKFSKLYNLN